MLVAILDRVLPGALAENATPIQDLDAGRRRSAVARAIVCSSGAQNLHSCRRHFPRQTAARESKRRPMRVSGDRKITCVSWLLAPARPAGISAGAWLRPDGT